MDKVGLDKIISLVASEVVTIFIYLFGGIDVALTCLIVAIVLDYVSGMIKAYNKKQLSSKIGFSGILKKIGILILVMLSVLVDRVTGNTGAIRTLVIYYFVANEGLSVLENLSESGIPIPTAIKKALKVLKDQSK